ncbi:xanthine dehydrogenase family protein subunit M [Deltaproteobacteria bacterium]|nr:xanthine dehydrogenase family protein subunit M [Deltaproteobacteria bacterium]
MKSFNHISPGSLKEAIHILKEHNGRAVVIAGGTDLLSVLKDRLLPSYPETVINIKSIPGLDNIKKTGKALHLGPLCRLADIANSPEVLERFSILAEAAKSVATPHIRNMATIGGNLCQDVRCWYYRYPHHLGGRIICHRKGKGPCHALKGDNRYSAIMGTKKCFAVSPSDTAVALSALDAEIKIIGKKGERSVSIRDFYTPMGNILNKDELVTGIRIPLPHPHSRQSFIKFTQRKPVDFAIVSVASVITVKEGICADARIALGGVAPMPIRAFEAEQVLIGRPVNKSNIAEAADAAVSVAKPLSKNAYKIEITRTLIKRSILI